MFGNSRVRAHGEALGLTGRNKNFSERLHAEIGLDTKLALYESLVGMGKSPKDAREAFIKTGRTAEDIGRGAALVDATGKPAGYEDDRSVKRMLVAGRRVRRRQRRLRGLPDQERDTEG
jgi:hypothetical protein